jgi:hypothetical protein
MDEVVKRRAFVEPRNLLALIEGTLLDLGKKIERFGDAARVGEAERRALVVCYGLIKRHCAECGYAAADERLGWLLTKLRRAARPSYGLISGELKALAELVEGDV